MNENNKLKSNKGFSLVEMLIVMAIMAIVMSMSFGGFYMIKKSTINGANKDVESTLEKAQGYATSKDYDEVFAEFYLENNKLKSYVGLVTVDSTGSKTIAKTDLNSLGNKVSVKFVDNKGVTLDVGTTTAVRVYYNKRSGEVTKVTKVTNGSESNNYRTDADYAQIVVYFTNDVDNNKDNLRLYYFNGSID